MHSFLVAVLGLTLIHGSSARVAHSYRDLIQPEIDEREDPTLLDGVKEWLAHFLRRDLTSRQNRGVCYEDVYYNFVQGVDDPQSFCDLFISLSNVTLTEDYTPTR